MIRVIQPSKCSSEQIETFCLIVKEGGQIKANNKVLMNNVENASILAFFEDNGIIVGVASIKNPNIDYKRGIFAKAGILEMAENFDFEIGYCVTLNSYRRKGINTNLLKALLASGLSTKFYATTKSDDMRRLLSSLSFKKAGSSYTNAVKEVLDLYIVEL